MKASVVVLPPVGPHGWPAFDFGQDDLARRAADREVRWARRG